MLGFRNLEVEIKATSKTGARRMELKLLEGFPSLSAGDLQGSWRECGGSAEAAPRNPSLNFNFTSLPDTSISFTRCGYSIWWFPQAMGTPSK